MKNQIISYNIILDFYPHNSKRTRYSIEFLWKDSWFFGLIKFKRKTIDPLTFNTEEEAREYASNIRRPSYIGCDAIGYSYTLCYPLLLDNRKDAYDVKYDYKTDSYTFGGYRSLKELIDKEYHYKFTI